MVNAEHTLSVML